jgi:hypothetical protein
MKRKSEKERGEREREKRRKKRIESMPKHLLE